MKYPNSKQYIIRCTSCCYAKLFIADSVNHLAGQWADFCFGLRKQGAAATSRAGCPPTQAMRMAVDEAIEDIEGFDRVPHEASSRPNRLYFFGGVAFGVAVTVAHMLHQAGLWPF